MKQMVYYLESHWQLKVYQEMWNEIKKTHLKTTLIIKQLLKSIIKIHALSSILFVHNLSLKLAEISILLFKEQRTFS